MRFKVFGVLFMFLLCFSSIGYSQSMKERMFYTFGYSTLRETLPSFDVEYVDYDGLPVVGQEQLNGFAAGLNSRIRMNIINLKENSSFSLDVVPELNYFWGTGTGNLYSPSYDVFKNGISGVIPVFVSFNIGAGSTYDTDKNFGVGLSAGFEYQYVVVDFIEEKYSNHGYFYPSVQLSIRYWRDNSNSLRELSFKFGIPSNGSDILPEANIPYVVSIAWTKYLNY